MEKDEGTASLHHILWIICGPGNRWWERGRLKGRGRVKEEGGGGIVVGRWKGGWRGRGGSGGGWRVIIIIIKK